MVSGRMFRLLEFGIYKPAFASGVRGVQVQSWSCSCFVSRAKGKESGLRGSAWVGTFLGELRGLEFRVWAFGGLGFRGSQVWGSRGVGFAVVGLGGVRFGDFVVGDLGHRFRQAMLGEFPTKLASFAGGSRTRHTHTPAL